MFNIKVPILLIGFFAYVKLDPINFLDCGSDYDLVSVDIEGCSELPCIFKTGTIRNIYMEMYASEESHHLQQIVHAKFFNVYVPMSVSPNDPCTILRCPLNNNHNASFIANMNITNDFVLTDLTGKLEWTIKNDQGTVVLCMIADIRIELSDK